MHSIHYVELFLIQISKPWKKHWKYRNTFFYVTYVIMGTNEMTKGWRTLLFGNSIYLNVMTGIMDFMKYIIW